MVMKDKFCFDNISTGYDVFYDCILWEEVNIP